MSVGKDQHVAVSAADFGDHAVGAATDILRLLAARAAVAPQGPVWIEPLNLLGGETLVAAVIPLHQVGSQLSLLAISREAGGLEGALQGAREDERKLRGTQPRAEGAGLAPSLVGQGKIRFAGVAKAETPFGFPVARQHHRLGQRGWPQPVRKSTREAPPLIVMSNRLVAKL